MFDIKLDRKLLCLGLFGSLYASSPSSLKQTTNSEYCVVDVKEYLVSVAATHCVRDVAEVLNLSVYFVQRFLYDNIPYDCVEAAFLKYSTSNTLSLEVYLKQQYQVVQSSDSVTNVDRAWEERFQSAAISQLLLPKEFKNPVNINNYLELLRGIDSKFEPWLHSKLCLYSVSLSSRIMNTADNYRVYETIRDYYRAGGAPLSVLLAIKVAEENKKKEAEEWHFSDVLHWLPLCSRSSSIASARSSDQGTPPPNGSFGSNASSVEQHPLLDQHAKPGSNGLRQRHVMPDSVH